MQYFNCPYCNYPIPLDSNYLKALTVDNNLEKTVPSFERNNTLATLFKLTCPSCQKTTLRIASRTNIFERSIPVEPLSYAKPLPDYIPEHIRNDYKEACAIVYLSPKASATLSRRCLQSMIRDFWNIKKDSLNAEITALQSQIEPGIYNALHNLRGLGNIGAHPEKNVSVIIDIEPEEAHVILELIEMLFEKWYITRNKENSVTKDIETINQNKQLQRKQ